MSADLPIKLRHFVGQCVEDGAHLLQIVAYDAATDAYWLLPAVRDDSVVYLPQPWSGSLIRQQWRDGKLQPA